ncbi:hypothetical protein [Rubeoparvulum massiliense]|uniref:hypothetical protein n=1 Tax=Rubeoparvulum massiliense TaxID=1631346 RepID=UPI0012E00C6A|nr:hypothetical protein [Rubeoparvulum massiliense]
MDKNRYTKTGTNINRVREQNSKVNNTEFGTEMDANRPATNNRNVTDRNVTDRNRTES